MATVLPFIKDRPRAQRVCAERASELPRLDIEAAIAPATAAEVRYHVQVCEDVEAAYRRSRSAGRRALVEAIRYRAVTAAHNAAIGAMSETRPARISRRR